MSKIIGDINQQMKQATPPEELRKRFMDRSRPATEAEHWARRRIEALEAENLALKAAVSHESDVAESYKAERDELLADAKRYRYARDHGYQNLIAETPSMSIGRGPYICMELPSVNKANMVVLHGDAADKTIDAAIAKGEKKP